MPGAIYSSLAHRLAARKGQTYPLHVGDTWMEPPEGCRMEDIRVADHPGMHRYADVQGMPALLRALAERVSRRSGLDVRPEQILVAAGATGGLGAVVGALVAPGEEVLILAPFWPLIAGIVRSFRGVAVPVPFVGQTHDAESAVQAFAAKATERTVAVYLNSPNNPTGAVLPRTWIEGIIRWAESQGYWVLTDEVYEDYVFEGEHVPMLPFAPERTFANFSFSKAFGMAGNRCGYVVGPAEHLGQLRKVSTHTFYSTPTAAQIAALRALDGRGDAWAAAAREQYRATGNAVADALGVPRPQGSTFLFLDVAPHLDERGLQGFLEDCVDQDGLLVAPGPSFGPYPTHIRLCFTCSPPDVVLAGAERLARRLGR